MNLRKFAFLSFVSLMLMMGIFNTVTPLQAQQPFGRGGQFGYGGYGGYGTNFGRGYGSSFGTGLGITIGRGGVGVNFGSGYYPNRNQYYRSPLYGPRPQYFPPAYGNQRGYQHPQRAPYAVPYYPPQRYNYPVYPPFSSQVPVRTYVPVEPFHPVATYPRLGAPVPAPVYVPAPAPAPAYQSNLNPYELGFVPKSQAQEEQERLQAEEEHKEHSLRLQEELRRHQLEMERIRQVR